MTLSYQDGGLLASYVKEEFNVDADEVLDMLNSLIQEGMVETFSIDGTHFRVIHDNTIKNPFSF